MLTAQSSYFKRALLGEMQEGKTRKFEYSEGSMHAYWRVFEYMYKGTYSEEPCMKLTKLGTSCAPQSRDMVYSDSR